MTPTEREIPILIVAGGPGGLISSIELSNPGIPHRLVNDRAASLVKRAFSPQSVS
jgi:heterodisulfide reductase subunit A-like polyferredoxin